MQRTLKAPFPWFGGKSRAADLIWSRFGSVVNYVEPFAGSLAVLLQRPQPFTGSETVNDKDALIANFWRALAHDPEQLAFYADWPVSEPDLHARHIWLVENRDTLARRLEGDPEYYDVKVAGWWVWGIACWIGSGWCSGRGPWRSVEDAEGFRQLVHLGDQGRGVNRQLVHLSNQGQGVNRKRVELIEYFFELSDRLRAVRVCCGDWQRVTGPSVTTKHGLTAVLLDPPYSNEERAEGLYTEDCGSVAAECARWAIENGNDPNLRIALCGYATEHQMPDGWECVDWEPRGGYDGQNKDKSKIGVNRAKERIWFSPNCVKQELPLFAAADARHKGKEGRKRILMHKLDSYLITLFERFSHWTQRTAGVTSKRWAQAAALLAGLLLVPEIITDSPLARGVDAIILLGFFLRYLSASKQSNSLGEEMMMNEAKLSDFWMRVFLTFRSLATCTRQHSRLVVHGQPSFSLLSRLRRSAAKPVAIARAAGFVWQTTGGGNSKGGRVKPDNLTPERDKLWDRLFGTTTRLQQQATSTMELGGLRSATAGGTRWN